MKMNILPFSPIKTAKGRQNRTKRHSKRNAVSFYRVRYPKISG